MKTLIVKLLTETITDEELEKLSELLNDSENQEVFEAYIRDYHDLNLAALKNDVDFSYKKVLNQIKKREKPVKNLNSNWIKYAVAASIIILISLGILFKEEEGALIAVPVNTNSIESGTNKATLTLEDGSEIVLEEGKTYKTENVNSTGDKIVYNNLESKTTQMAYNYLTIPRGGEFFIKLSDGTQVWLNSESQLKYPVDFIEGQTRQVELIYGEAYFEVSPSTNHKGSKFKVFNKAQEVEVLGTKFNIKANNDDVHIYTTLVEGKVAVNTTTTKQILKPNEQSKLNVERNNIEIIDVDVKIETAWIKGDFIFQNTSLKEIMKVLSRWYDVDVEFENKSLEEMRFVGELSKYQNLEDILLLIKNSNNINDYEIDNKKVILK